MIKFLLILLILVGGFTLMSKYTPQLIGATFFHIGQYAITGGVVAVLVLLYAGYKCVG